MPNQILFGWRLLCNTLFVPSKLCGHKRSLATPFGGSNSRVQPDFHGQNRGFRPKVEENRDAAIKGSKDEDPSEDPCNRYSLSSEQPHKWVAPHGPNYSWPIHQNNAAKPLNTASSSPHTPQYAPNGAPQPHLQACPTRRTPSPHFRPIPDYGAEINGLPDLSQDSHHLKLAAPTAVLGRNTHWPHLKYPACPAPALPYFQTDAPRTDRPSQSSGRLDLCTNTNQPQLADPGCTSGPLEYALGRTSGAVPDSCTTAPAAP